MNKGTEEAIKYLRRVIKTSKETAYNLVYQDLDIQCLEIVLDYIEKECIDKQVIRDKIEQLEKDNGSTQLVSKDGGNFEFKKVKKEL